MPKRLGAVITTVVFASAGAIAIASSHDTAAVHRVAAVDLPRTLPGGLGALPQIPLADGATAKKVKLGRLLFFDRRLSGDRQSSCATCHRPAKGFADGLPTAVGFGGKVLRRHTPTVLNAAYNDAQFWDGRAGTLEEQAVAPLTAADEMNMPDENELVSRLSEVARYRALFSQAFGGAPSRRRVVEAIAAYERTLTTGNSKFDRYARGDHGALTDAEKRGLLLFVGKAACSQCHLGPNFTDNKFHNIGLHAGAGREPDPGRYAVTRDDTTRGAFKTPTLRNVGITAPFMHDGSLATLRDVVDYYDKGGETADNKSERIVKLGLTEDEKHDLISFLDTLTGSPPDASIPEIPR